MRIAILADIHGNILALEAALTDLESRKVDKFVNLGDCVSGPLWPRETAELLMRLSWPTVRGNHDRWVTDWPPDKHYRSDAFAYQALESSQLAWLRALPATLEVGEGVFACHGRPNDDNAYLFDDHLFTSVCRPRNMTVRTQHDVDEGVWLWRPWAVKTNYSCQNRYAPHH
jgi:predicted phosphodiesterase